MRISLQQLKRVIREEVSRSLREGPDYTHPETEAQELADEFQLANNPAVPSSEDELREMIKAAAPSKDVAFAIDALDLRRLWQNVKIEIDDGTPWEDIVDHYVHDWLIQRFSPQETNDILNHV